ncbi:MAG: MFS transporter [Candidatus Tectomicrobia bacterium]|nr:MFS transporter [Candidatus Tectomicrobia bacterium]
MWRFLGGGIYYGWVVVAVAFTTLAVGGSANGSFGIFYGYILKDLGGSRSSTALAFSITMLVFGFGGPLIGRALDRFGPRLVVPAGVCILGLGLVLSSRVTSLWQLYLVYGIVAAFGVTALGFLPVTASAASWFVERRGTAISIALAGRGVGSLLLFPFYQHLITTYGWRSAYLLMAVLIVIVLCPLNLFLQRPFPRGASVADRERARRLPGRGLRLEVVDEAWTTTEWTVGKALRTRQLWYLVIIGFFGGISFSAIGVHQVQHLVDSGFDRMLAVSVLASVGILRSFGGILGGVVSDRIGRELAYTLGAALSMLGVASLLSIAWIGALWPLYVYVGCYGIGNSMASSIDASTQGDIWQGAHLASILGIIVLGSGLGGAVGPWVAGYVFDRWQTYVPAFLLILLLTLCSILGMWLLAPRNIRRITRQAEPLRGAAAGEDFGSAAASLPLLNAPAPGEINRAAAGLASSE